MDEEVDLAPDLLDFCESGIDRRLVADIAVACYDGADFGSQRLDALSQRFALVSQGDLTALGINGLGDTPGNRTIVGDAHDDAALARHQSGHEALQN